MPKEIGLDGPPLSCCSCSGPVGVVVCVRGPLACTSTNYHGSWIEEKNLAEESDRPIQHVICEACEERRAEGVLP